MTSAADEDRLSEREREAMYWLRERVGLFIFNCSEIDGVSYITELDLGDTEITDAELPCLAEFEYLEWLCLEETGISDDGLAHLVELRWLKRLELGNSRVTPIGIATIRQNMPGCDVVH